MPKETQVGTAVQTPAVTTNQNITTTMGSLGPPIPGTLQLRTPPRPTQVVMMAARNPCPPLKPQVLLR